MNLYISFGKDHYHKIGSEIFDEDCIAEIKCSSIMDGKEIALDLFGENFNKVYTESQVPDEIWYIKRGFIEISIRHKC